MITLSYRKFPRNIKYLMFIYRFFENVQACIIESRLNSDKLFINLLVTQTKSISDKLHNPNTIIRMFKNMMRPIRSDLIVVRDSETLLNQDDF